MGRCPWAADLTCSEGQVVGVLVLNPHGSCPHYLFFTAHRVNSPGYNGAIPLPISSSLQVGSIIATIKANGLISPTLRPVNTKWSHYRRSYQTASRQGSHQLPKSPGFMGGGGGGGGPQQCQPHNTASRIGTSHDFRGAMNWSHTCPHDPWNH